MLDDRPGVSFCPSQPLNISLQTEKLLSMRREQRAVKFSKGVFALPETENTGIKIIDTVSAL